MKLNFEFSEVNLLTFLAIMLIGGIIAMLSICSCVDCSPLMKMFDSKENFGNILDDSASIGYKMGVGVPGDTWAAQPRQTSQQVMDQLYASLSGNKANVPNLNKELFFFQENSFKPECCFVPQQYSSSTGCTCISPSQMKFLSSRGGNNNLP